MSEAAVITMFGRDHSEYDTITTMHAGPRTASSISVGRDLMSPSLLHKGSGSEPNEDALVVVDAETRVAVAVADAHHGVESSHRLIERLAEQWSSTVPGTLAALIADVDEALGGPPAASESASTLLAAVVDRSTNAGFGVNFGDSTLAVVRAPGQYRQINEKDNRFVASGRHSRPPRGSTFEFPVRAGDVVVLHTDGVDECHYRRPETSVRPEHVLHAVERFGSRPSNLTQVMARLALNGVGGHPGGQDNIAVIATLV